MVGKAKVYPIKYMLVWLNGRAAGQRGQTVNLLALLSVVRIHHPPPTIYKVKWEYSSVGRAIDC